MPGGLDPAIPPPPGPAPPPLASGFGPETSLPGFGAPGASSCWMTFGSVFWTSCLAKSLELDGCVRPAAVIGALSGASMAVLMPVTLGGALAVMVNGETVVAASDAAPAPAVPAAPAAPAASAGRKGATADAMPDPMLAPVTPAGTVAADIADAAGAISAAISEMAASDDAAVLVAAGAASPSALPIEPSPAPISEPMAPTAGPIEEMSGARAAT